MKSIQKYIECNPIKKNNNGGFSLVELIVVVMISAILVGGAVVSAVVIHDANVSAATDELVSILKTARSESLARESDSVWLKLVKDSDSYYAYVYYGDKSDEDDAEILSEQKLGSDALTFTIKQKSGSKIIIDDSSPAVFDFKKSNGALKEDYTKIEVEGNKTEVITVIRETGRCLTDE